MFILEKLISNELRNMNKKFHDYHSMHEAYAIIKEEIEEAWEEFSKIQVGLEKYWKYCRNDKNKTIGKSKEILKLLDLMTETVIKNIQELIQVGAVIEKIKKLERND